MNIAILVSSLKTGGAEKQAILDANLLSEKHTVLLIYFYDGELKKLISSRVKLINIYKVTYLQTLVRLVNIIKNESIELLHASLFASIFIASVSSVFTNVRIIWHFHSHEYNAPFRIRLAFRWLAKLNSVKRILFVNRELMESFYCYNFPANKLGVLYNHSDIKNLSRSFKTTENSKINVGYIGRIVELKRVHLVLELAQFLKSNRIRDLLLHIIGDGDILASLKEESNLKDLNDLIVFHGFQSRVLDFYMLFDLFINPSSEECLSMAMIDAGMMALPVVAFDVGGNDEIVINNQTGYIVHSKEEFFQKILILINNEALRLEMGQRALEHCSANFSEEVHLKRINNLYKEVLG